MWPRGHTWSMSEVDPEDDSVMRFVVQHFRYDAVQKTFRRVAIAAYDNAAEYERRFEEEASALDRRRSAGDHVHRYEKITGMQLSPHHSRDAARERQAFKAVVARNKAERLRTDPDD